MERVCSVPMCPKPYRARGYCVSHYSEQRASGELDLVDRSPEAKLFPKIEVTGFCWLWTAALNKAGYGTFKFGRGGTLAHRAVYEWLVGPIPEGLVLDHLCRVRHCVNPDHLEPVTLEENFKRGFGPHSKTHCPQGHEYTENNTIVEKAGKARRCRACHKVRQAAWQRKNRYK